VNIEMPTLRARAEDIRELVAYFLGSHSVRHNIPAKPLSHAVMIQLEKHRCPGTYANLRI